MYPWIAHLLLLCTRSMTLAPKRGIRDQNLQMLLQLPLVGNPICKVRECWSDRKYNVNHFPGPSLPRHKKKKAKPHLKMSQNYLVFWINLSRVFILFHLWKSFAPLNLPMFLWPAMIDHGDRCSRSLVCILSVGIGIKTTVECNAHGKAAKSVAATPLLSDRVQASLI